MIGTLIVFLISIVICCVIVYVTLQLWFINKRGRNYRTFFALGLEIFLWTLLNAIVMVIREDFFPVIYTLRMIYVAIVPFGVTFFILEFTSSKLKDSNLVRAIMFILPGLDIAFLVSNPLHHLYFTDYSYPMPTRAIIFWIHLVIDFLFVIITFIILLRFTIKNLKETPILIFTVIGLLVPYTINMLYTFGIITFEHDLTPIGFFVTFILFAFISYRNHLFNIATKLFSTTMNMMTDIIIILSEEHTVLDFNKSAGIMFSDIGITERETNLEEILGYLREHLADSNKDSLSSSFDKQQDVKTEFTISIDGTLKTYVFDYRAVHASRNESGYILIFSDVSSYHEMIEEIIKQNSKLEALTKEAEEASIIKGEMLSSIETQYRMLEAVNKAANFLLNSDTEQFDSNLMSALREVGTTLDIDRVYIWRNSFHDGEMYCSQVYEWSEDVEPQQGLAITTDITYRENIPGWYEILSNKQTINNIVSAMSIAEQVQLEPQGILSILVTPVFVNEEFWGFVGFDNCKTERLFSKEEEAILLSASLLFVHAYQKSEIYQHLKQTSEQLEVALVEANAASKAKGDFLSNMSHEMRTPMNAIIGMTTIAKNTDNLSEKNTALGRISDASTHLLGVINDVLDMAKIEADKLDLFPVEFNLEELIKKVLTVTYYRITEKKQNFTVNIAHDIPRYIIGDDQRLTQVLTNLISNANKFTPINGNISLSVSLVGIVDNVCEITFTVTDDGIGISPEQLKRLFAAFSQAEAGTSREYGGTGLGLVITKRIVELMNGNIRVESELGKGSSFIATVKVGSGVNKSRALLDPDVNWKNIRLLVATDNTNISSQFTNLFEHLEVTCHTAKDIEEVQTLRYDNAGYDIYFIDYQLSNASGLALAKKIYESDTGKKSVVVMISSNEQDELSEDMKSDNTIKYILKPLFSSSIIDCINECLGIVLHDTDKEKTVTNELVGKYMLLAEDIEINREILISLLEDTGISIDCAENGKIAVNMIKENPTKYDIVFMDIQMPEMDGLEATRQIRKIENDSITTLPIIAMTANVFKEDIEACLDAGMNSHLGKPLDINRVVDLLHEYLLK